MTPEDLLRFRRAGRPDLEQQLEPGHFSQAALPTRGDGACQHLGSPGLPHHCSIYELRPDTCRAFAVGGSECLSARRRGGLEPS